MTTEDINQITAAVIAQLRQGATDLDGIKASSTLADTDNVIAANGSTVKKLPVSLFKKIVASGATVYRLMVSGQTFKGDTTAVLVGVTKSEGGKIEQLTALPKGWRIKVEWKGSASAMSNVLSAPGTINPNAAAGSTSVEITLYDGDPTTDQTAQTIDEATLLLVSDGAQGAKGDTGEKGDKGDTGAGAPVVIYEGWYLPNSGETTDTTNFTDSTQVLQPTAYVGNYTDADGKEWTGAFECEGFPDWFDYVIEKAYPYNNGIGSGMPFVKDFTADGSGAYYNFDTFVNKTKYYKKIPCFSQSFIGIKKIDDTHFKLFYDKTGNNEFLAFDPATVDCSLFAFGNRAYNLIIDISGSKKIRVSVSGHIMKPSQYSWIQNAYDVTAFAGYQNLQVGYGSLCVDYEIEAAAKRYRQTRVAYSAYCRRLHTEEMGKVPESWSAQCVAPWQKIWDNRNWVVMVNKRLCFSFNFGANCMLIPGAYIKIEKIE